MATPTKRELRIEIVKLACRAVADIGIGVLALALAIGLLTGQIELTISATQAASAP